jgi:hemolysin III
MYDGERFNRITHLVGAVLALVGVTVMVTIAAMQGEATRVLALTVYGVTLFLLYLFSTLYHSLRGRAKAIFQVLDHHAIYLLIAGTYTPFTLLALKGSTGWWLFGAVWTTPDLQPDPYKPRWTAALCWASSSLFT